MDKIVIKATPVFCLDLRKEEIHLLMELGKLHYDITCKQAVVPGGFIHGWNSSSSYQEDITRVTASSHDLDITLKILEFQAVNDAKLAIIKQLSAHILAAMRIGMEKLRQIEIEIVEIPFEKRLELLRAKPVVDHGDYYQDIAHMLDVYHIPKFNVKE